MKTFQISDVQINSKLLSTVAIDVVMKKRIASVPEAFGADTPLLVDEVLMHGFIAAAHTAFKKHYPLTLSPDMIWLCIAQGFAQHVNNNAEVLRDKFVKHQGKIKLNVIRNEFIKGSSDNDWLGVFAEFSNQISSYIGKQRDLVVCDFSTTTPLSRAVSEITLLDTVQSYFSYRVLTLCGIPQITLLGTVDDWKSIRDKAAALTEYDLDWWTKDLLPVLDQFVAAMNGLVDKEFWQSFYKWNSESGGALISGWINVFFPYLKDPLTNQIIRRNKSMALNSNKWVNYPCVDHFPSGLSQTSFVWHYLGTDYDMSFVGGFVGAAQEVSGDVRPSLGWAVVNTPVNKE